MLSPRPLNELVSRIEAHVADVNGCKQVYSSNRVSATTLAHRLPLVHRTGSKGDWRLIFERDRISAEPVNPKRTWELMAPREQSAYLFLGACAYDMGHVALLLAPGPVLGSSPATFTPYDTGGMSRCAPSASWTDQERRDHMLTHTGAGQDLLAFAATYVAAHFHDPSSYVSQPQTSATDFPPFHGLTSNSGDRRSWTIEVQSEEDVTFSPEPQQLSALVVRGPAALLELPDQYRARAQLIDEDADFFAHVAGQILGRK